MTFGKFKIFIILLFFSPCLLFGNGQIPFSELKINILVSHNINKNVIHEYWQITDGLNFYYQSPFYYGNIIGGLSFFPYDSKSKLRPDFQSYYIYLGWLYDFPIHERMIISPGFTIGDYLMNFDINSEYDKFESEISTEIFCKFSFKISPKVDLLIEYGQQNVYTYKMIKTNQIKLGFGLELDKPVWLLDIFK